MARVRYRVGPESVKSSRVTGRSSVRPAPSGRSTERNAELVILLSVLSAKVLPPPPARLKTALNVTALGAYQRIPIMSTSVSSSSLVNSYSPPTTPPCLCESRLCGLSWPAISLAWQLLRMSFTSQTQPLSMSFPPPGPHLRCFRLVASVLILKLLGVWTHPKVISSVSELLTVSVQVMYSILTMSESQECLVATKLLGRTSFFMISGGCTTRATISLRRPRYGILGTLGSFATQTPLMTSYTLPESSPTLRLEVIGRPRKITVTTNRASLALTLTLH